jgi:hypothetical protein
MIAKLLKVNKCPKGGKIFVRFSYKYVYNFLRTTLSYQTMYTDLK